MYKDKFVLSVLHDGSPVKETGPKYKREIAIPFDSEYKIRLKNKNDRSCTARVFVDGKRVSQLGDIIITAGATVDLERFIDRSLTEGKRFKFVPLDHPDVDDPTSSKNGIIKVEFRLAKQPNGIKIHPWLVYDGDFGWSSSDTYKETNDGFTWTAPLSQTSDGITSGAGYTSNSCCYNTNLCDAVPARAAVEAGATIEGGKSAQSFVYSNLEVEDNAVVLNLKLVGIKDKKEVSSIYKFCSNCGHKVRRTDKYCSECGRRL